VRGQVPELSVDHPARGLFQLLPVEGLPDPGALPPLEDGLLLSLFRSMVRVRLMDERLLAMQRQGRIGFYGEARGQEAAVIGAAAALGPDDWHLPALRDAGGALHRGLTMRQYVAQIFGNANDPSKGHQLPCHPGTRAVKYVTMSSCIASQVPHAVGVALAARLSGEPAVALACLGDGASSEPDFHVAMNFAGVMKAPVVFFLSNNQWAISTPSSVQSVSDTFAMKAVAYGMPGVRVDGNDVLAVYVAVRDAVERARRGEGPTLVEALTYRVSAHSSSDDPSRYRDETVTEEWKRRDPIDRLARLLSSRGLLDEAGQEVVRVELEEELKEAIAAEESASVPPLRTIIDDVFAQPTPALEAQLRELEALPRQKTGGVHA
jgi:pyruvate dehydrogenase E1 component alpha subunit/2-oxoisovalerate dehydrogenase E1 component alpha subunit